MTALGAAEMVVREGERAVVRVDETIYSCPAILRAAYWITDRAYVLVRRPEQGVVEVVIRAKGVTLERPRADDVDVLAGELCNALLEHQLREEIADRTA